MSEPKVFLLPDLGEGLTEAELVNWLVAVGDEIRVDQPIAEVETAKSMVEVPSPYAGTVAVLHGEPGQTLDVGKPLISVTPVGAAASGAAASGAAASGGAAGGAATGNAAPAPSPDGIAASSMPSGSGRPDATPGAALPASAGPASDAPSAVADSPAASPSAAAAEAYREEEKAGSGNVLIGYGTPGGHGVARRTRAPKRASGADAGAVQVSEAEKAADELILMRTRVPGKLGAVISPLVRRMARDHGVDLGGLQGSGTSGMIMRRDVEAAIKPAPADEQPVTAPQTAPVSTPETTSAGGTDSRTGLGITGRTPVRGVRKAVAANMSRSRSEIPEATVWVDVDATALVELRAGLKKADPHHTPGLLAFIARFVTAGLRKYPELNTRIVTTGDADGGTGQEIVGFDGVNLACRADDRARWPVHPERRCVSACGLTPRSAGSPPSCARARRPRRNWAAAPSR